MKFTKMEGAGNDYIYIDCTCALPDDPAALARRLSHRHFGVGGDGIVLICPSDAADLRMRMFNADGSEAEMCGNAIRCVGKYAYDRGMVRGLEMTVETGSGVKTLDLFPGSDGKIARARVNMGVPELRPEKIPVLLGRDRCIGETIESGGRSWAIHCVSMGNPHAVIWVDDAMHFPVAQYGSGLETHPVFPRRCNIEFATVTGPNTIDMRVWERGSGETLACGTGACATAVAAMLTGRCEKRAEVSLRGGRLTIEWEGTGHPVYMTGPAAHVFDGEIEYR
ncbi:MAG: diaminopimelate epimerase [Christensenellales bacterium]